MLVQQRLQCCSFVLSISSSWLYVQGEADPYTVALYILRFLLSNNSRGGKKGPFFGDVSLAHIPGALQGDEDARKLQEASRMNLDLHWMVGVRPPAIGHRTNCCIYSWIAVSINRLQNWTQECRM